MRTCVCLVPLGYCFDYTGRFWPLKLLWRCPSCRETVTLRREPVSGEKRVLITCEGIVVSIAVSVCVIVYSASY